MTIDETGRIVSAVNAKNLARQSSAEERTAPQVVAKNGGYNPPARNEHAAYNAEEMDKGRRIISGKNKHRKGDNIPY